MTITPLGTRVLLRPFIPKSNPRVIAIGEDRYALKKFVVVEKGDATSGKFLVGDVVLSELGYIIAGPEKLSIVDEGDIVAVVT